MHLPEVVDLVLFELQVKDFNVAKSDKAIGYYAGFIGELVTEFRRRCSMPGSCQVGMFILLVYTRMSGYVDVNH